MAYGLPIIARHAAAAPEVVHHGQTGILLDNDSPQALANAVAGMLQDGAGLAAMGQAARLCVRERFHFNHFAARWLDWLTRALPEAAYLVRHSVSFPSFLAGDEWLR